MKIDKSKINIVSMEAFNQEFDAWKVRKTKQDLVQKLQQRKLQQQQARQKWEQQRSRQQGPQQPKT